MITIVPVSSLREQIWDMRFIYTLYCLSAVRFAAFSQKLLELAVLGFAPPLAGCCRPALGRWGKRFHHFPPDAEAGCHWCDSKSQPSLLFYTANGTRGKKTMVSPLLTRHPGFWLIVHQQDMVEFETVRLVSVLFQWSATSLNIDWPPLHKTRDAVEGKHFLQDNSSPQFFAQYI